MDIHLYDHNCISYDFLKNKVVDILDHHKDLTETFYPPLQSITKNIQNVGSATTLLGEYFIQNNSVLEPLLADAILKTVLIDSYNFDPRQQTVRWNNRDLVVA